MSKQTYVTGVRCGNWFEDLKGMELSKHSQTRQHSMEISETKSQYYNRYPMLEPSAPAIAGTDAIPGRLVFAHGPDIVDDRLAPDHYMSTTAAVFTKGFKPQDIADRTRTFAGANNRTELIAQKAKMRAAGVDPWEPTISTKASVPSTPRTVFWTGTPSIPVEGLGARPSVQYTSVNVETAAVSSTAAVTAPKETANFARDGKFTKSFKSLYGEGCVPAIPR